MSEIIKLKKGLNIRLKGVAEKIYNKAELAKFYAVKPTDFHGVTPKLLVNLGDSVKAGSPLYFDKNQPDIVFTSPVSGTVNAINRGERRRILEIVIETSDKLEYIDFGVNDPENLKKEEVKEKILKSGLWASIIQRPFNVIANPKDTPKAIFISGFDSAPLAPDYDFLVKGSEKEFQAGITALSKLTEGKINVGLNADYPPSSVFTQTKGIDISYYTGPHPVGNVGVQIHHTNPILKGDLVWTINPQHVISIGRLFIEGKYDVSKVIALTGSEVKKPKYYKLISGCRVTNIIEDNITNNNIRVISGNVLTGIKIKPTGYLSFYDSQITVIPEGDHYEFLGWASPGFNKFSYSRSFFSWLFPSRKYRLDTNLNGGHRSLMITGKYEKVLPMELFPMQLIKAIIIEDIDLMEKLGIYEIAEEDFALCEYICTSKTEIQDLIRKGLDLVRKEVS